MELTVSESKATLDTMFTLKITQSDKQKARIRPEDQVFFDHYNREDSTIADKLLGLVLLARRVEEAKS